MNIGVLSYADDILVISDTVEKANSSLKICEDYGIEYDIKWNPEKTQFMEMNKNAKKKSKKGSKWKEESSSFREAMKANR